MKAVKIFAIILTLFALLTIPAYADELPPPIETPPIADYADPESIPQLPPIENADPESIPQTPETPPATSEGNNETQLYDADLLAIRGYLADTANDVRAIREYTEFFLFGVLPIGICIAATIAGCIWFRKTFVTI